MRARSRCSLSLLIFLVHAAVAAPAATPAKRSSAGAPLRGLNLHDRIAQLIVVRGYGDFPPSTDAERQRFERWIHLEHVGGFIVAGRIRNGNVLSANPYEMAAFVNHAQQLARTPLLVAADFERGASMRASETASFPYQMAFGAAGDYAATRQLGAATAVEARAMGVNWVFAPDADVNNNPDNPIINTRSFGEDPQAVARHVAAFIDGAHSNPNAYVLVSAKHFPGHGDTADDSHMQLARVTASRERMDSVELVPFRSAIAHGADSIMTAHLAVAAIEPDGLPATLSKRVLTGLLRDDLHFDGIVVTDALEMQGITSLFPEGEAAVRALEAGADVLLMPTDPEPCIQAITAAIASGRLTRARIDHSVSRVLAAKAKLGLFRSRLVSADRIADTAEQKPFADLAQSVAEHALTLLSNQANLFPVPAAAGSCLVLMTENQFSSRGEVLLHELVRNAPAWQSFLVNSAMPDAQLDAVATATQTCARLYVAAFVTVAANRGSVALEGGLTRFVQTLLKPGAPPVALIALGNPYLSRQFPNTGAYLATFSSASSSEVAVAHALLNRFPIDGHSPISIPPGVKCGDGISVPAQ